MKCISLTLALVLFAPLMCKASISCEDLFPSSIPSKPEVEADIKSELEKIPSELWQQIASHLSDSFSNATEKLNQIRNVMVKNAYFESNLPDFIIKNLATAWLTETPSPTIEKIKTDLTSSLLQRRLLYYERRRILNAENEAKMSLDPNAFNKTLFLHFTLYKSRKKLTAKQIMDEMPSLDRLWRRYFDVSHRPSPAVVLYEVEDIPGTFLAIFNDIVYMNNVFQRASLYIEQGTGIINGPAAFGVVAGGHDLKGPDLAAYNLAARAALTNDLRQDSSAEYIRRLSLEHEFFDKIINRTLQLRGPENVVFLASASDFNSLGTVSHEIWHARYFTDKTWRRVIQEYWAKLSKADQQLFKNAIKDFGYDLENEDLMANEFHAYMLQQEPPIEGVTPQEIIMNQMKKQLRAPFKQHLARLGLL